MSLASILESLGLSRFYSRRWEMAWLLFTGATVVYTLRVNMSVAAPKMRDNLGWSDTEKGYVLSAFYWGYSIGQIPSSQLVQHFGGKWIFGLSVLIPSFLTLLVPVACEHSLGLALFLRAILGFFESATFPAIFYYFPIWVPLEEKTLMIPAIVSGMYMGEIIGFSLSGVLVEKGLVIGSLDLGTWESVFYVFGFCGIVWFPYWAWFAYDTPESHPKMTIEELALINKGKDYSAVRANEENEKTRSLLRNAHDIHIIESGEPSEPAESHYTSNPLYAQGKEQGFGHGVRLSRDSNADTHDDAQERVPWAEFFRNPVSLMLFANAWVFGWIGFTLLSEMPSFLSDILGFDLESAGILCVFPYMALFASVLVFGSIFEYLQVERGWTTDRVRRVAQTVAYVGSILGLILCGFMSDKYVAYVFMIATQFFMGASQIGLGCAYSDVAPNFSSALNSVGNTIGSIAGIVGPLVVSAFCEAYPGVWGWRAAFLLTGAMGVVALALWWMYQTSEPVKELNNPRPRK